MSEIITDDADGPYEGSWSYIPVPSTSADPSGVRNTITGRVITVPVRADTVIGRVRAECVSYNFANQLNGPAPGMPNMRPPVEQRYRHKPGLLFRLWRKFTNLYWRFK